MTLTWWGWVVLLSVTTGTFIAGHFLPVEYGIAIVFALLVAIGLIEYVHFKTSYVPAETTAAPTTSTTSTAASSTATKTS